jgi:hypothetical protein
MPKITVSSNPAREVKETKPAVSFTRVHNEHQLPFLCYAYFEALLTSIHGMSNNPNVSSTRPYKLHEAMSFSVLVETSLDPKDAGNVPLEPYV